MVPQGKAQDVYVRSIKEWMHCRAAKHMQKKKKKKKKEKKKKERKKKEKKKRFD